MSDDDNWTWQGPETDEEVKRLVAASIEDAKVRRQELLEELHQWRVAEMHYVVDQLSPGLPRAEMI